MNVPFAALPLPVLEDRRLDPFAVRLYAHYVKVCGGGRVCYQSDRTIAGATGISIRKIIAARLLLEATWYIAVERDLGAANRVTLLEVGPKHLQREMALGPLVVHTPRLHKARKGTQEVQTPLHETAARHADPPLHQVPTIQIPPERSREEDPRPDHNPDGGRVAEFLAALRIRITPANFDTYFRGAALSIQGDELTIAPANALQADWIAARMKVVVSQAAASVGLSWRVEGAAA